jgi:4-amino-4-deoxy-L-arabinose transferase-like glycosyltransferase
MTIPGDRDVRGGLRFGESRSSEGVGPSSGISRSLAAATFLLPVFVFFVELGTPALWDPDEGRNAEIARELLVDGQWRRLQLGFEPYRERLPAYYWLVAASLRFLPGDREFAARFPSAAFGVAGVWSAILWARRRFHPRVGLLSGWVLATSAGAVGAQRLVLPDGVASVLLAAALFQMGNALLEGGRFPIGFWLALAAAVAVRGPGALVLAALVAVAFASGVRDPRRLLRLRPVLGAFVLGIVLAPYALAVHSGDPAVLGAVLWRHGVLAYLDHSSGPEPSPLLLLWLAPLLLLPWGLFLPLALPRALRAEAPAEREALRYLFAWAGGVVAFGTVSAARVGGDVLPALFPLGILVARFLDEELKRPASRVLRDPILGTATLFFVALLLTPIAAYQVVATLFPAYSEPTVGLLLLAPLAVPGLAATALRNRVGTLGALAGSSVVTLVALYRFGGAVVTAYNSLEIPAGLVVAKLPSEAPLLAYGTSSHSLAFYAGRAVRNLDSLAEAEEVFRSGAPAALLTKERHLEELRSTMTRPLYYWWESDSRKLLLSNVPAPPNADRRLLLPRSSLAGDAAPRRRCFLPEPR